MTRSDSIAKLAEALAQAQAVMVGAAKDSTNPHFRSKYADLAAVWEACRGPLTKHGLSVVQMPSTEGPRVTVATLLMHSSGEFVSNELSAMAKDDGPQGIGSVITYLRRYGLAAVAGVAPEDDDAEAGEARSSGYVAQAPAAAPRTVGGSPSSIDAVNSPSVPNGGGSGTYTLKTVKAGRAGAKGEFVTEHGEAFLCYDQKGVAFAEQACQDGVAVVLTFGKSTSGNRYVKTVKRAEPAAPVPPPTSEPLQASDIPF